MMSHRSWATAGLSVLAVSALIGGACLPAQAAPAPFAAAAVKYYPESAYPKATQKYVPHPAGFNDSTTVRKLAKGLDCSRVPRANATGGGHTVSVRKELAPLVTELMRRTEQVHKYDIRMAGGFNCRYIRGSSTSISNHAYARAVDINWDRNPMQPAFKSDIPPAVVKMWTTHGFYWGGHYSKRKDTMHFEYVAPLNQISTHLKNLKAGK